MIIYQEYIDEYGEVTLQELNSEDNPYQELGYKDACSYCEEVSYLFKDCTQCEYYQGEPQ